MKPIKAASWNVNDSKIQVKTSRIGPFITEVTAVMPLSMSCNSPDTIATSFPDVALAFDFMLNLNIFRYSTPAIPFLTATPRADQ